MEKIWETYTENRWEISTANQKEEFDLELLRKEKKLQALKEDLIQKGNDIQELYSENSKLTSRIFHLEREIRQKDIKIIHGKLIFRWTALVRNNQMIPRSAIAIK